jgi:tellurite methyltransferase
MEIQDWDKRYRLRERPAEDFAAAPAPLLIETANRLRPGRALDLACGTGRNALWLVEHGWRVTAVDGSATAIEILRRGASERGLVIGTAVADLEKHEYAIDPSAWDLIAICYYLQRDIFEPAKQGLAPGGVLLAIVHLTEPGEHPTNHRLPPGELQGHFRGWEILHCFEGQPSDPAHQRSVAEIVARRPGNSNGGV